MSLVKTLNNKGVIKFGIKLCQLIPQKLAYTLIKPFASFLASFKETDLIKAIQANQRIVSGAPLSSGKDLRQKTCAVLQHALICYYDFFHNLDNMEKMAAFCPTVDQLLEELTDLTDQKGALIITPHLSNFNLVFQVMTSKGFKSKLLTLSSLYSGYGLINHLRAQVGVDIISADEGDHSSDLVHHLKSGDLVVTAVDRPIKVRKSRHRLNFFGYPSDLPAGYISLALAANVPVIILAVFQQSDGTYDYHLKGPIPLKQRNSRVDTILYNAERILQEIEYFVKKTPEQWLMYYPVWPDLRKDCQ